jgi:hypothetical protein
VFGHHPRGVGEEAALRVVAQHRREVLEQLPISLGGSRCDDRSRHGKNSGTAHSG